MKCWPIASGVVTDNSPVGLLSRPATRRSNSRTNSAMVDASAIISSPAAVGSYPARERSNNRAPTDNSDRRQAPEHRRMIDPENFGRADQRAGFRDRLDQSKFVPAQS